jgi:hypothetical protein
VGKSSRGRKGTAWDRARRVLEAGAPDWAQLVQNGGLSSGEGLIWAVRDPTRKKEPVKKGGIVTYREVIVDHGIDDKRLPIIETEFASVLKNFTREGNKLSSIMRAAWDSGKLGTLTKNSPARATDAHVSVIGHIVKAELLRYFDDTEAANGFGNRILWHCVDRSKLLPLGGNLPPGEVERLGKLVAKALTDGKDEGELERSARAQLLWGKVYRELSIDRPGLVGALVARSEAQVLRLSMIYALLDSSRLIKTRHVKAALAVWRYCEASVEFLFGDSMGDPIGDTILKSLRASTGGLTRTEIRDLFSRHQSEGRISQALSELQAQGLASCESQTTGGRPVEHWRAA